MESFVATKLEEFENGKISRRRLIEILTFAATTVYAGGAAKIAAADPALGVGLVNHISYNCPDFRQTADWYSTLFNLDQVDVGENGVNLPLGKEGEKPYNVTADDVPLPFLIVRTRDANAPAANSGVPRRQSRALIDGIAYTIADFDADRVRAELRAMGIANAREDGEHSFHLTDVNGFNVQISGVDVTALSI